jgi:hypothetical protein
MKPPEGPVRDFDGHYNAGPLILFQRSAEVANSPLVPTLSHPVEVITFIEMGEHVERGRY